MCTQCPWSSLDALSVLLVEENHTIELNTAFAAATMPWLEGNTRISKKYLSLIALLASHSVRDSPGFHRAGVVANHQNYAFQNYFEPNEHCPKRLFRALCRGVGNKSQRTTTLCKLFYLDSILMGLAAGTKSKPIWFSGYKFVGVLLLIHSLLIGFISIYNSCRLKLICCTVVHFYYCSNI